MDDGVKIVLGNPHLLNARLHQQLHVRLYELIDRFELSKDVILVRDAFMKEWAANNEVESDVVKRILGAEDTKTAASLDVQRDELIDYIFGLIQTMAKSPDAEIKASGKRLVVFLEANRNIKNAPYEEETVMIANLLRNLLSDENIGDVVKLNLRSSLASLEDLNNQFDAIQKKRTSDKVVGKLPTGKEIREKNDRLVKRIIRQIEAAYVWSVDDGERVAIKQLADHITQCSADLQTAQKKTATRSGTTDAAKETDDADVTNPEAPFGENEI